MPNIKLIYFELPGRGETTRLLFTLGKIPFEYCRVPFDQWPSVKPTTPFGQLPVLEVDGKQLAQSAAIELYAAKLAGLYPDDPWQAAKVDELVAFLGEWYTVFSSVASKDPQDRPAARKAIVESDLNPKIAKLNELLSKVGPEEFVVGPKLTYADIAVFSTLSWFSCGFYEGVPKDLYKAFPAVTAFHTRIASLPEVKGIYESATEGCLLAFKPATA